MTTRDFSRFDRFLDSLKGEVYPEAPGEPHLTITRRTLEDLRQKGLIKAGDKVLDVGCGQGLALKIFREFGIEAIGTGLGPDVETCRAQGFDVRAMDQNFMDFPDESFDVLWCRHVLEHSVAPLFTLSEYKRLTKPGGLIYVEVPAPDTSARHEHGRNHYSVMQMSGWLANFERMGLVMEHGGKHKFEVGTGPDIYFAFNLRKPA
ncbi:MAG: class I SAM-dependent methyltransferase [Rhodospirillaceae bacterium]|nr:class I SAM-dependent methyltransferase [Rhodospirillaceae bacterium]